MWRTRGRGVLEACASVLAPARAASPALVHAERPPPQQVCKNCKVPTDLVEDHAAGDLICKARCS